jgi:hypothetical protein
MDHAVWKEITIFRLRNVHSVDSNLQDQVKFNSYIVFKSLKKKALYMKWEMSWKKKALYMKWEMSTIFNNFIVKFCWM